MNDEGLMMIESAEEEVQGALALMERGRKTLKEARAKQHQVKMSRQFYRTDYRSTRPSGGSSTTTGGFAGKCLKCGVVGIRWHSALSAPRTMLQRLSLEKKHPLSASRRPRTQPMSCEKGSPLSRPCCRVRPS